MTLTFDLWELASYDDTGLTGHAHRWVLEAGTYEILAGPDVRAARPVLTAALGRQLVGKTSLGRCPVVSGHGFSRLVRRRGEMAWEPVPTANPDLRSRILARLPEGVPPIPGREIPFDEVAAGRATAEDFVAQLSPEALDRLTRGQGKMNAPFGPPGNAGAFGGVTEELRALGLPAAFAVDGPGGHSPAPTPPPCCPAARRWPVPSTRRRWSGSISWWAGSCGPWGRIYCWPRGDEPPPRPPLRPEFRVFFRGPAAHREDGRRRGPGGPVRGQGRLPQALRLQQPGDQPLL